MLFIIVLSIIAAILAALFITQKAALISVLIGIFAAAGLMIAFTANQTTDPLAMDDTGINAPTTENAPLDYSDTVDSESEMLLREVENELATSNDIENDVFELTAKEMPLSKAEKAELEETLATSRSTKAASAPTTKPAAPKNDNLFAKSRALLVDDPAHNDSKRVESTNAKQKVKAIKKQASSAVAIVNKPASMAQAEALEEQVQSATFKAQKAPKARKTMLVYDDATARELDALTAYTNQRGTVTVDSAADAGKTVKRTEATALNTHKTLVDSEAPDAQALGAIAPAAGGTPIPTIPSEPAFFEYEKPVNLNRVSDPDNYYVGELERSEHNTLYQGVRSAFGVNRWQIKHATQADSYTIRLNAPQ